ncbi:hypothetical protein [Rheinheimera sp. F8]|uniref:hypothetical protein n=1 Tax=Rheinheimera sp. F8 TaxID=1763998 RepID=UPI000744CAB9|nr:hypothetical protein [Rheinheimera sp. F8]ALZ77345.1 hypothetical protein ATY27_17325 [Rheinheimera sp. F8]
MQIEEIAEYVWLHSKEIEFGDSHQWDENLFLAEWAKNKPFATQWRNAAAGWYWFLVDMNYEELHDVVKPPSLPQKGCNIGLLTHSNMEVFGETLLCSDSSGITVIYNGHEANVTSRIRSHFALNNNKTGALGLSHYPLSNRKWFVRYFSSNCFTDILENDRLRVELLMNSKSGRCAVEHAWRVNHGWPVLCKE